MKNKILWGGLQVVVTMVLVGMGMVSALAAPIIASASTVTATFRQFNVPVSGTFRKFQGQIAFNPSQPKAMQAQLEVDTASYDLGDAQYNREVAGSDWFASKKYPIAVFKVTSVEPNKGQYTAVGTLTLRGVSKSIRFPVTLEANGKQQIFTGKVVIKRLDYGVGQGDWADTSLVNDEVEVSFRLVVNV